MSHPTTKACLPRVEHVRFIPPCLRCRCRDCPAHPQTATRESQPEITPVQSGQSPTPPQPTLQHTARTTAVAAARVAAARAAAAANTSRRAHHAHCDAQERPETTPGWTHGGGRTPPGATPPPATPNLPPQPEHTLLAGQSSRRSGGGRGDCHAVPGLANGSGTSLFQPRAVGSSTRSKVPLPIIQAESRIRHANQQCPPFTGTKGVGEVW